MPVEFSLLELASVRINETPCDSFTHAVAYAISATAILIGHIAGNTQRLRVGADCGIVSRRNIVASSSH